MTKLQKSIEKTQSTQDIEKKIQVFKRYRDENMRYDSEQNNYFVLVEMTEVKESTIQKVGEWL
jgi:aspartyl-tRNA synthetase